ncbi:MAG TPA: hypothetical protein VII73_09235 [Caulobacteraceae bacterium]
MAVAAGVSGWARLTLGLLAVCLAIQAQAGLCQEALEIQPSGKARLAAARRLLAVWILTVLFVAIVSMLALVVIFAMAYGVASSGRGFITASPATWAGAVDERGRWVVDLTAAVAGLGVAWAWARISLAPMATLVGGRVVVLSSWAKTRNAGAPILVAAIVVAAVPAMLLWTLASLVPPSLASHLAQGCILAGLWFPQSIGLMAYFHRRLGPFPTRVSPPV